jgi:hypothetical protein
MWGGSAQAHAGDTVLRHEQIGDGCRQAKLNAKPARMRRKDL